MLDFWKNKRILVTGHTGFKGSWLTEALLLAGAEVTGYALEPPTDPSLFELLKLKDRMRSVTGDVRDLGHLLEVFRETQPEFVLHMAAQPIVRLSYREPVMTYETNVMGTVNICECVRQSPGVRSFLNVTTDKVYENGEKGTGFVETDRLDGYDPYSNSKSCSELVTHGYVRSFLNVTTDKVYENGEKGTGFVETDRLDGYDPYSNSKSCSELVTHGYVRSFLKEQGVAVSTARAGNVIGGGDFAPDRIVPDCVRAAQSGSPLVLRNPDSVRPFQHVLEPVMVYLDILEKQAADPSLAGAYNVGPDLSDCVRTGELAQLFADAWNREEAEREGSAADGSGEDRVPGAGGPGKFRIEIRPDGGPHEAGFLRLECGKLKEIFGWEARWHIAEAVQKTADWSRAWLRGEDMIRVTDAQIREFLREDK